MGENVRDSLLSKALAVDDIPEDFDPKKIPETGEEYLHLVMYETMHCEEFVSANIDVEKYKHRQTLVTPVQTCKQIPRHCLFADSWQESQIGDFSAFRLHVQRMRDTYKYDDTFKFCGEMKKLEDKCLQPPKTYDILNLKQNHVTRLLNAFTVWLRRESASAGLPYSYNVWLYALLSCIEVPIWPEQSSVVRNIARLIANILCALPKDTPEDILTPFNLIFCIIIRYFNNTDLLYND